MLTDCRFYQVKLNKIGVANKRRSLPLFKNRSSVANGDTGLLKQLWGTVNPRNHSRQVSNNSIPLITTAAEGPRRKVLIATMEYDIEDWQIKIKIGGLGVMAQLMGKNLGHQDLIWVVPCVGGIVYPTDQEADPMEVTILGKPYDIQVTYHVLRNITYVLLDAPVFRAQSKSEPYPPRMDDLDSAVYYSAWNQCIALAVKRFEVDLYHINDYHGAAAPLYLLPDTIPCCLSLHNAEFQGLWPMRNPEEQKEVCEVFNLSPEVVKTYVQFGDVFNLLHAGSSYLRIHQKGFGAVGVSKKYAKRSWARYPIFWGLSKIGELPNPDPEDTGAWDGGAEREEVQINEEFENGRADLKRQAQEWAGLIQDPHADLLVFVGRWSMQKGIDLIADVMPAVLEENEHLQLICIGPVIDLYGKFAALKLDVMMKKYPGRVYSKPEFTALPPFIFSGAEFALIPSRDEPFGLVAVEFGRKGALGIGARVGGLGQMVCILSMTD
jgi:alpha-1,3-glucan synthase